jgi:hypothetical protein
VIDRWLKGSAIAFAILMAGWLAFLFRLSRGEAA